MKKVILIPTHNAKGNGGGIRVYNEALESLFKDDDELCVKLFKTLPKSSPLGNYYSSEDISLYLEKEQPDIIHINGYTSLIPIQLVKYAHKHNIKIVFTPHWHPFETMTYPFLKKTYFNLFISPILKKIDHIFTINNEEYDFFKTKNRNVSLISHWIYDQSDINSSTFSKQPNMILFVGNPLYKNKGFDHLLALRNKGYELNVVCRTRHDVPNDIIQHINVSDKEVKNYISVQLLLSFHQNTKLFHTLHWRLYRMAHQ